MTVDLKLQGMTCVDCAHHIERALKKVPGVTDARVDYRAGRGTVELSRDVADRELLRAVEGAGYRAQVDGSGASSHSAPASPRGDDASRNGNEGADYDLLVIGTGGAGMAAAIQGAELGAKVAIAEGSTIGGTCVNVGCIPSKNLIEAAAHYHSARKGFPGIKPCDPAFAWRDIIEQKRALVEELRQSKYIDVLAAYPGNALLQGQARLLGDGRVRVGDVEHRSRKVVIATGTRPSLPPIPGLVEAEPLDSTTVMEVEELPKSMIVLGGSAVGLELAQTFSRFGVKVTVIELMPRLLPNEDETISEALKGFLAEEGLEIHTGVTPTRIERDGSSVVVHVTQGSLTGQFRAERLLVATGRRPNTADLGLEDAGVVLTNKGFVQVDANMQTSSPDIFAAGDVTGGPGFVYVAAAGGRVAAENALKRLSLTGTSTDELRELDLSVVPGVTFTAPPVASVGLTEAQARAAGHDVQVSTLQMEHVPRALVSHDRRGLIKVVTEGASGKLLGVHVVAPNAGELIGEATMAIRFGLTVRDLTGTLHPYLTWVEGLKLAAQTTTMDVSRLSCCA